MSARFQNDEWEVDPRERQVPNVVMKSNLSAAPGVPPALSDLGSSEVASGLAGFVWIAPGIFSMGGELTLSDYYADAKRTVIGPELAFRRDPNRKPDTTAHLVTLTQGFWMSDHEVTRAEFDSIISTDSQGLKGDADQPVANVSWDQAQEYCRKLTEREQAAGRIAAHLGYRLPTEAEWEYAARAGTTGSRYGDLDAIAWYSGNSWACRESHKPHPVRQKAANAWGLYDMLGNVSEWCADWYKDYPSGSITDPMGPRSGYERVIRGGYYMDPACEVNSWYRCRAFPSSRFVSVGFRPVLSSRW